MDDNTRDIAKSAVVAVRDACGFIIEALLPNSVSGHFIITAAHCLPHLPPADAASDTKCRTYQELVGRLDKRPPKVWAECVFADPVADIAVLERPDDQALKEKAKAYDELIKLAEALPIADAPEEGPGWLLTLDRKWMACEVQNVGRLWIFKAAKPIVGGMSGSPILNSDGAAIGVVCCSSGGEQIDQHTDGGPNPSLTDALPGNLLRGIGIEAAG